MTCSKTYVYGRLDERGELEVHFTLKLLYIFKPLQVNDYQINVKRKQKIKISVTNNFFYYL